MTVPDERIITRDIESLILLSARAFARSLEPKEARLLWSQPALNLVFAKLMVLFDLHHARLGKIISTACLNEAIHSLDEEYPELFSRPEDVKIDDPRASRIRDHSPFIKDPEQQHPYADKVKACLELTVMPAALEAYTSFKATQKAEHALLEKALVTLFYLEQYLYGFGSESFPFYMIEFTDYWPGMSREERLAYAEKTRGYYPWLFMDEGSLADNDSPSA